MAHVVEVKLSPVPPSILDEVVAAFERVVPGGVTVEERRPGFWTARAEPAEVTVEVALFLEDDRDLENRVNRLERRLDAVGARGNERLPRLAVRRLPAHDWEDAWRRRHTRQPVGERLLVIPAWDRDPVPAESIPIHLEIGQAFGLGTHASTRLCLKLLERIVTAGDRVLDVGSGSGILGIAALRLGAREVCACDVDPVAVEATQTNAALNRVADRLEAREGGADAFAGRFDLVVANIVAEVILDHLDRLIESLEGGGQMLLGGIHVDRLESMRGALRARGMGIRDSSREEGFVALVAARDATDP